MKKRVLDEHAEELFKRLGGIDKRKRRLVSGKSDNRKTLEDRQRLVIVDLLCVLESILSAFLNPSKQTTAKDKFPLLVKVMGKLNRLGQKDRTIVIRNTGFFETLCRDEEYVVTFGTIRFDSKTAPAMFAGFDIGKSRLLSRVNHFFHILSDMDIHTLCLNLPKDSMVDVNRLKLSLQILAIWPKALKSGKTIPFRKNGNLFHTPLIKNENDTPDFNLTLLAGFNNIQPDRMRQLVEKTAGWMENPEFRKSTDHFVNVFEAILGNKNMKGRLARPLIEINNPKWLILDTSAGKPQKKEKLHVARLAMMESGGSPAREAKIMASVYGDDFEEIDALNLGERLSFAGGLLDKASEKPGFEDINSEVLGNIEERLELVKDEVIDDLFVENDLVVVKKGENRSVIGKAHQEITPLIDHSKRRSQAKRKIKEAAYRPIEFTEKDYEIIAKTFDVAVDDARELIETIRGCFDEKGNFQRTEFENSVPILAWYENKIFEFMWFWLKTIPRRNDRVAFLNALQHLIAKLGERDKAIHILWKDFLRHPETIEYSDRNGMMLSNILVRTYNKELSIDIEKTPEEILNVIEGLDEDVISEVKVIIEKDRDKLFRKAKLIHKNLFRSLQTGKADQSTFSLRFIMSLEREMYIFLSLLGGRTARSVIASALREYGDPKSRVFEKGKSGKIAALVMNHLKTLVRCLGRIGELDDASLLDDIKRNRSDFEIIDSSPAFQDGLNRVLKWIETSRRQIMDRNWADDDDGGEILLPE